jgi:hypothetical protein
MSASDAAPLPRLGEVFFDVRGSSRSMRLSWYADTGVAVFSIWQGGMCTGTFRLPIGDLGRMIEILQRGPHGYYEDDAGERGGPGYGESAYDADYEADYAGENDGEYRASEDGRGNYGSTEYGRPDDSAGDYGRPEYGAGKSGPADYGDADYGDPDHSGSGRREAGHRAEEYGPAGYGPPEYEQAARAPRPARWHDDGRYQPDVTGQRSVATDATGYGQQRFVPPYVRAEPDSSQAGFLDDSEYRPPADPAARTRHSAGRHSSGHKQ